MKILMGSLLICFMVNPIHAENYRWIDKEGVVNFSNELPSDSATVSDVISIPEISFEEGRDVKDRVEEINYATQILQELRAARLGITHEELLSRNSKSNDNRLVTMSFSDRKKIDNLNRRMRHISSSFHSATQAQLDAARTEIATIHSKYGLETDVYAPAPVASPVIYYNNGFPRHFSRRSSIGTQEVVSHNSSVGKANNTIESFAKLSVTF